jgi:hypothetical protein
MLINKKYMSCNVLLSKFNKPLVLFNITNVNPHILITYTYKIFKYILKHKINLDLKPKLKVSSLNCLRLITV